MDNDQNLRSLDETGQNKTSAGLPRRRNGKLQSCENCRLSKNACDHAWPSCGRCLKRGIRDRCVYHPAPMTKPKAKSAVRHPKSRPHQVRTLPQHSQPILKNDSVNAAASLLFLVSQRTRSIDDAEYGEFVGPTSYSAIIRGNQDLLGRVDQGETTDSENYDPKMIEERANLGSRLLALFPTETTSRKLMDIFYERSDFQINQRLSRNCLDSLWTTWAKYLSPPRTSESLLILAKHICHNMERWQSSTANSNEDCIQWSAGSLRWEWLGILFASCGIAVISLNDWSELVRENCGREGQLADRKQWAQKLGECAKACLILCEELGVLNEIVLWLMILDLCLGSYTNGDDARSNSRNNSTMCSAIKALGVHRGPEALPGISPPFSISEQRKRLYISAYVIDKQVATFHGRPPELSNRYSHCDMPLELTDDELELDGAALEAVLGNLDSNGWRMDDYDSDKMPCISAGLRACYIASTFREEILELSLGPPSQYSDWRRDDIRRRSEAAYASLPAKLRLVPGTYNTRYPGSLMVQIMLSNDFLLNNFLLDRLPNSKAGSASQKAIDTATELLNRVILQGKERDRLAAYSWCFSWTLVYYGISSATFLAIELLIQHQHPNRTATPISRSAVIQHLSVFASSLDTVRLSDANFKLCVRIKKVICKILDQLLAQPTARPNDNTVIEPSPVDQNFLDLDLSFMGPSEDTEFVRWLESVDWSKGGPLLEAY